MADGIVPLLTTKALESLAKSAVQDAAFWWGAREDLNKLRETIEIIQARVRDAERRQEDADAIKEWLLRLKQVLYRANDLFDEVLTLDRLKQQRMEKGMLCKVGMLFTKSGPLCYNNKLANDIKSIRIRFDDIKSDMDPLDLSVLPAQEPLMENSETSYFVNIENVVGRGDDKNNIIEVLFDPKYDGENITIIPIVGFGGLGKTTLAQLVFNDERVQNHFDLTAWAYVPVKDDLMSIKRNIFYAFTHDNFQNQETENIEQGIINYIKNNKYLLVLDDLWIEDGAAITKLVSLLRWGKHGSKVIVTTRSDLVAKHFGPIEAPYRLGTLTNADSWKLFEILAFGQGQQNNNAKMSAIGKDIVRMCGNVPLAIKVVGQSLRSMHNERDWLLVKDNMLKAQPAQSYTIMATLKVSYDYLPRQSKLCFAYSSLFPKGYKFEKEDLVHLWMAQGYVEPHNVDHYFWYLVAANLFQGINDFDDVDVRKYKMHDLLHDLAQYVAGKQSMILGNEPPNLNCSLLEHVNLDGSTFPPSLKDAANRLQSLLNLNYNVNDEKLLLELHSLRVLSMELSYKKLPETIGRLKNLRYLKIEKNAIEYLPESITRLVNLQTLNLKSCSKLKELPRDFAKLVNLRHLLLPYEKLTDLPPGFGKLTSLQELNRFIVGKGNGIDSLGDCNFRGELVIEFCRWRRDAIEEGKRANLKTNQLTSLILDLHFKEETSTIAADKMNEMLNCLLLPPYLKGLTIEDYKGDEMPTRWLHVLSQLVSIKISGCEKCKVLPDLSGLPHLKSLELYCLHELEYVEDEHDIRVGTVTHKRCFFPSLEFLWLEKCYKIKGWRRASNDDGEQLLFPRLLKMKVFKCPMLMSMPLAPKLELLEIWDINGKMVESNLRSNHGEEASSCSSAPPPSSTLLMSVKELDLRWVGKELISLSIGSNLSILKLVGCSELRNVRFDSPNSIRQLYIQNCSRLNISEGLQHLSSVLEKLYIKGCPDLAKRLMQNEEDFHLIQQMPLVYIHDGSKTFIKGRHD